MYPPPKTPPGNPPAPALGVTVPARSLMPGDEIDITARQVPGHGRAPARGPAEVTAVAGIYWPRLVAVHWRAGTARGTAFYAPAHPVPLLRAGAARLALMRGKPA